ncbi:DUF7344 domain-containing protein [Halopiger goleimassiliensis]|uniref:DUF7344 domain-containing protein n=1 Tax=Halopiger goleimassiliensis TaxID=1293048 RepID=UPI0006777D4B|nr:hypothetical protein [Halopiger goleimassiliensis]
MNDDLFDALAAVHRRRILVGLLEHNPRQLSEQVERDSILGRSEIDEVRLRHEHAPKLDDCGFIEWDREAGRLTRGPRFEEIEPALRLLDDNRDRLPDDWV